MHTIYDLIIFLALIIAWIVAGTIIFYSICGIQRYRKRRRQLESKMLGLSKELERKH